MKDKSVLFGIVGIFLGIIFGFILASNLNPKTAPESPTVSSQSMDHDSGMSMDEMSKLLNSKTGDDFDKAFIEGMIIHHQGAIDMAKQASASASHQEIKDLSSDIISAQTKEINQMQSWQEKWGYK